MSIFDGKYKVLCENSMVFNAEHSGLYPQLFKNIDKGDTYNDSTDCAKHSHNIGCFTYGPVILLLCGVSSVAFCPLICICPCHGGSSRMVKNTFHWMRAAPCLSDCYKSTNFENK